MIKNPGLGVWDIEPMSNNKETLHIHRGSSAPPRQDVASLYLKEAEERIDKWIEKKQKENNNV